MKIPGLGRVRRIAKLLRNRFALGGLILLYHRIAEEPSDPFKLCVTPRHFAQQLEVLKQHSQTVSLQHMIKTVRDGKSVDRMVAITFDDGYADNLLNAKPLLEKYDIPATVFVATGNLENQREFWWDELERILLQPGKLPQNLCLSINSRNYEWDLGAVADYSISAFECDRAWNWYVREEADPSHRQRLYRQLYQLLSPVSTEERQKLLDDLLGWSGIQHQRRLTHRSVSAQEVHTLQQNSLIEIGAHTVNHPFLSTMSVIQQQYEMLESKTRLEEIIQRPVNNFAYPHGDYTTQTTALARQIGFGAACSTISNKIRRNIDCFELPRMEVKDWDGEEFERQLSRWFYFE